MNTAVVTGATGGLGLACAEAIARAPGWHVVLAVRDGRRGAAAAAGVSERVSGASVETLELDLASLGSVRTGAARLARRNERAPLRAIVCNAAIQVLDSGHATADGFELTFGVNHLGHFLLVTSLLNALAAPARVVVVSSGTHHGTLRHGGGMPAPDWRDPRELARPRPGPGRVAYTTSKLANLYFTYELARRVPAERLGANAFDPGMMPGTELARDASALQQFLWKRVLPALRHVAPGVSSPEISGEALARMVIDPAFDGVSGRYYAIGRETRSSEESYDGARAEELWSVSEELVEAAR